VLREAARRAGARAPRESWGGHRLPGWILDTVNAFLVPVVGIELRPIKQVSFEEETTDEETAEEESDVESEDELEEAKELSDEELAKYVEEKDYDFELTADEISQTEAEEAVDQLAVELEIFADRKSPCFENKNMEQIIESVNQTMLEHDPLPEEPAVQSDPEVELTAAELEAAERERLEAAEYEEELEVSSYSCPVPQCDMAPIG
jgi:hypothetical protein